MKLKVNMPYPKDEPLSTVPPDVLKTLPVLPKDLEYRFVGKHLILYDARAGLVVDYFRTPFHKRGAIMRLRAQLSLIAVPGVSVDLGRLELGRHQSPLSQQLLPMRAAR